MNAKRKVSEFEVLNGILIIFKHHWNKYNLLEELLKDDRTHLFYLLYVYQQNLLYCLGAIYLLAFHNI